MQNTLLDIHIMMFFGRITYPRIFLIRYDLWSKISSNAKISRKMFVTHFNCNRPRTVKDTYTSGYGVHQINKFLNIFLHLVFIWNAYENALNR